MAVRQGHRRLPGASRRPQRRSASSFRASPTA